mgnify:CR=1 FL=1
MYIVQLLTEVKLLSSDKNEVEIKRNILNVGYWKLVFLNKQLFCRKYNFMLDKVEVLRKENTDVLDINLHQNEDVKNEQHLELFRFLG